MQTRALAMRALNRTRQNGSDSCPRSFCLPPLAVLHLCAHLLVVYICVHTPVPTLLTTVSLGRLPRRLLLEWLRRPGSRRGTFRPPRYASPSRAWQTGVEWVPFVERERVRGVPFVPVIAYMSCPPRICPEVLSPVRGCDKHPLDVTSIQN